jgi:hypothetical protein
MDRLQELVDARFQKDQWSLEKPIENCEDAYLKLSSDAKILST